MPHGDQDQPPTEPYIRELFAHNQTHWAPQIAVDTQIRTQLLNEHIVNVPDTSHKDRKNRQEPEKMTTGIGPHALRLVSSLYETPANLGVMFTGEGGKGSTIADRVEIGLAQARSLLNPATDSPRSRQVKHIVGLGRWVQLTLPGDVYWWDTPKFRELGFGGETNVTFMQRLRDWKRKAPLPILWQDLPPESSFPPSLGRVDDEVLSTTRTSWWELLDVFTPDELGNALPPHDQRQGQVILGIYANRTWIAWTILAEEASGGRRFPFGVTIGTQHFADKIIRTIEHKMGRCPIRIIPGLTGAFKEPGLFWRSILFDVREMIPQVDARFSEAATASKFTSMPWLKFWRNRSEEMTPSQAQAHITKMLSGDVVDLDAGGDGTAREDIQGIFFPPHGDRTLTLGQFQLDLIRRITGATEAIEGLTAASPQTAFEINFKAELAKGFFKELTRSVVAGDIDSAEQIIRAVVAFGEDIVLQSSDGKGHIVLKPDELKDFEPILKGEFQLRIPQNRRADIEQGISMMERVKAQDLPIDLFWIEEQFLDIEQPTEMYKNALKTQFILSPELKQWHLKQLLQEADVALAESEGMGMQEFEEQFAGQVPEPLLSMIRGRTQAQGELQGQLQGAAIRRPGGPRPQEQGV